MPAKKKVSDVMPAKKKRKKEDKSQKIEELEESEIPEPGGTIEEVVTDVRQQGRDELEALRRRLQEKFH